MYVYNWFYGYLSILLSLVNLKVPKCEIFHLFDFNDFYDVKSL